TVGIFREPEVARGLRAGPSRGVWNLQQSRPMLRSTTRGDRKGLSLLEAVLASAIIGASFVAFFGLAGQSMASASDARHATICTFLGEAQLNRLISQKWTRGIAPAAVTSTWSEFADAQPDPSDVATAEVD